MKKLSILTLALAACMMLSACDESTTTSIETNQQEVVHQPNIDEMMSNTASDSSTDNYYSSATDNYYSSAADSDYSSATSSAADSSTIARPTKPEIPQVEAISPSKLEYEFVNNGGFASNFGAGIKITAINTAAEHIRFPDTIDGEPVVYIDTKYSSNVKTLIFPDTVAKLNGIPNSVEFVKLPENLQNYINGYAQFPIFAGCKNLKEVWLPDGITTLNHQSVAYTSPGIFEDCISLTHIFIPDSVTKVQRDAFVGCTNLTNIYYKGESYTVEEFMKLF